MGGRGASSATQKTMKNALGKDVPFIRKIPNGWKVTESATTAPKGYVWVDNGKSRFSKERQIALVPESAVRKKK